MAAAASLPNRLMYFQKCERQAVGRVVEAGWEGLRGLEGRAAAAAASLLGAEWPAKRWPIHVFTSGAIICMLTSSVCHLLGCCSFHISQVRRSVHGLAEDVCPACRPSLPRA